MLLDLSQPIYEYQPKLERPATRPIYSYAWQKIELIKLPTDQEQNYIKTEGSPVLMKERQLLLLVNQC